MPAAVHGDKAERARGGDVPTNSLAKDEIALPSCDDVFSSPILDLPDSILDLFPVGVYVCDRSGMIIRCNRTACELWGRTPKLRDPEERFCGSLRMYRLDGGPLPHGEYPMAEVLRAGVAVRDCEVVIERPDGSRVVVLINIEPLTDATGRVTGAINCFRNITEQRRAESGLRDSEARFRDLLAALPVAVYTTDAAGRILYFNEAAAALWGHRPELGKDEWCGSWRLYWPDGRPMPHDQCPTAVALKEGRAIRGAEAIAARPDGSRVPFLAYPTPLRDPTGRLIGAVNTLVDISEHRRNEDARQWLAAIVEGSDDAIISKDVNGIITSWNNSAERLFGYTAAEVTGRPITILIPPDRHDEKPEILAQIRRGERVDHYETIRQHKDGSLLDISLTVSPIRDATGKVIGASKIARDITERKRVQEQQALLLREMNHRVKNLFALAGGVVTLSARSARTPGEMAAAVRERLVALARAHDLTMRDLTDGGDNLDRATTLGDLIRTIVSPHVDIEHGDAGRVHLAGPDLMIGRKAVTNVALLLHELATNAAKYGALSKPSGRIDVAWTVDGERLRLTWTERDGPPVAGAAAHEGFGAMLIRRTVTGHLEGEITREWHPDGLVVELSARLERLAL